VEGDCYPPAEARRAPRKTTQAPVFAARKVVEVQPVKVFVQCQDGDAFLGNRPVKRSDIVQYDRLIATIDRATDQTCGEGYLAILRGPIKVIEKPAIRRFLRFEAACDGDLDSRAAIGRHLPDLGTARTVGYKVNP